MTKRNLFPIEPLKLLFENYFCFISVLVYQQRAMKNIMYLEKVLLDCRRLHY